MERKKKVKYTLLAPQPGLGQVSLGQTINSLNWRATGEQTLLALQSDYVQVSYGSPGEGKNWRAVESNWKAKFALQYPLTLVREIGER